MIGRLTLINSFLLIILFHSICSPLLSATENEIKSRYYLRSWGIEHGLAQGTINSIFQTPDGYLWFANQEALTRFDGVRFFNYTTRTNPELETSWFQTLILSPEKKLIGGTWRGGIYEFALNRFRQVKIENAPQLKKAIIYALAKDSSNRLWIGSSNGLYAVSEKKTTHFLSNGQCPAKIVRTLYLDQNETLWIGSQDQGLWSYQHGIFKHFNEQNGLPGNRVWAICGDQSGLWIGCNETLLYLQNGRFTAFPLPLSKHPNTITAIAVDQERKIWLTVQNEGLWRLSNGQFTSLTEKDGLNSNLAISLFIDRENNVWLGTNGNGVTQLVPHTVRSLSKNEGLSAKQIWTVCETSDQSIWIGTHGGGINRLENGRITHYSLQDGIASMTITALFQSSQTGTIWIGTEDNGLMKFDNGSFKNFLLGENLDEKTIYAINEKADGTLLVGTAAGLYFFKDGKILKQLTTFDGLSDNAVRAIVPARSADEFWISTDIGLNLIRNDKVISSWRKTEGLSEDALNGIYLDREGNLWIGTYGGGLVLFQKEKFITFSSANGLHNDVIYEIIEDQQEKFWMSSNRGIFAVRKQELLDFAAGKIKRISSFPLGIGDGLKALECNGGRQPAAWLTSSGLALFATTDGVAIVNTKDFRTDQPAPPVIFESIKLNEQEVPLSTTIFAPPGKRNLHVEFTAPFFSAPEKIRFQYRLVPFESEWHENPISRFAHYTNIPPGKYHFAVRASNHFGVWQENINSLTINFEPFFYETLTFKIFLAILLIISVAIYVRWRVHHLERVREQLEATVAERTKELQEAYKQMEQMSLTDPLTKLNNRRFFNNVIDREIGLVIRRYTQNSGRHVPAVGFLMIDIDHFKKVNDQYGHRCGDIFLQMISQRFLKTIRSSDLIVRWGGEEFLILSKENDHEGARLFCRRLLQVIEAEPFVIEQNRISVTISIGFCPFPLIPDKPRSFSWEETVNLADQALYRAKESGRNRAVGIMLKKDKLGEEEITLIKTDFVQAEKCAIIALTNEII